MDTEKLITVTVWAALALIVYEVYLSVTGQSSTPIAVTNPQANAIAAGNALPLASSYDNVTSMLLSNPALSDSAAFFSEGGEAGVLGEFGFPGNI